MDYEPINFKSDAALKKACCPVDCQHKVATPWGEVCSSRKHILSVKSSSHAFFCERYNCLLGTFTIGSFLSGGPYLMVSKPPFCDLKPSK